MAETTPDNATGRLAFIVGASSGFGRALSVKLARSGWRVVVASRRRQALDAIVDANPDLAQRLYPQVADVTDAAGFRDGFQDVEQRHGPVDSLLLNAGDYEPMPLDAFDPELFRRLIEVNFLSAVNGLAASVPAMRARRVGQIIVTASLSAYRGLPRAAPYGASKAAVLNMLEALRPELDGTGLRLRVINPGFVKSRLTDKNDFRMPQLVGEEAAADYILREWDNHGFEIFFPKRFGWALKLLRVLPYRLYFAASRRMIG